MKSKYSGIATTMGLGENVAFVKMSGQNLERIENI
jgi:hypothetical protein